MDTTQTNNQRSTHFAVSPTAVHAKHDATAQYVIKGLKRFTGHHGEPLFKGSLALDGRKVAEWTDDYCGGPLSLVFINAEQEHSFMLYALDWFIKSGELARVQAQCWKWDDGAGQPRRKLDVDGAMAAEYWLCRESEKMEEERYCERQSKTKTLFRTRDLKPGEWRTYTRPYSPDMDAFVREKHGEDLLDVYIPKAFRGRN